MGLAPGRSDGCVKGWLEAQTQAFRGGIEAVVAEASVLLAVGVTMFWSVALTWHFGGHRELSLDPPVNFG